MRSEVRAAWAIGLDTSGKKGWGSVLVAAHGVGSSDALAQRSRLSRCRLLLVGLPRHILNHLERGDEGRLLQLPRRVLCTSHSPLSAMKLSRIIQRVTSCGVGSCVHAARMCTLVAAVQSADAGLQVVRWFCAASEHHRRCRLARHAFTAGGDPLPWLPYSSCTAAAAASCTITCSDGAGSHRGTSVSDHAAAPLLMACACNHAAGKAAVHGLLYFGPGRTPTAALAETLSHLGAVPGRLGRRTGLKMSDEERVSMELLAADLATGWGRVQPWGVSGGPALRFKL